jgi:hypothetical protein
MKDKISTFKALDFLNCNLKWINYSVEHIKGHQEALEHFIEKFEIVRDYDTDGEFLIKDYLFFLKKFIYETENLTKITENYLNGRGISNDKNTDPRYIVSNDNNSEND